MMIEGNWIAEFSPLPIVTIASPDVPSNGLILSACSVCSRKFNRADSCREFYKSIETEGRTGFISCPFGLTVYVFKVGALRFSFSGLVVHPRMGAEKESEASKNHPEMKISKVKVEESARALAGMEAGIQKAVVGGLKVGLHEIRKYNRTIKQEAERLCREDSPGNPHQAKPNKLRIWKTAELMSQQFEVLEFLGDENLFALPKKARSELYRILDKCVRIHEVFAKEKDQVISLTCKTTSPDAMVCDKTFPLIPMVLLDNAIKYAEKGTKIYVDLKELGKKKWEIKVENFSKKSHPGIDFFARGARGHIEIEGTGVGLYLAQKAAMQHGSKIHASVEEVGNDLYKYSFAFEIESV